MITKEVIEAFIRQSEWTHTAWEMVRSLFDDNPRISELSKTKALGFLQFASNALPEYSMQLIARLHDKHQVNGHDTLSVNYIIKHSDFDVNARRQIQPYLDKMKVVADALRPARDNIMAHNGLDAHLNDTAMGQFPKDADVQYFDGLEQFSNFLSTRFLGRGFRFSHLAATDAVLLCDAILRHEVAE